MEGRRRIRDEENDKPLTRHVRPKSEHYGIFAHKPVVLLIMNMLPVISQMSLFRALPALRELLAPWSIHEQFTLRLHTIIASWLGKDLCKVTPAQILAQTTAIGGGPLSVSAVLSALLGSDGFMPGDLDFYIPDDGSGNALNPCSALGTNIMEKGQGYTDLAFQFIKRVIDVDLSRGTHGLLAPGNDEGPQPLLQCVFLMDNLEPEAFIRSCFDLSFLRNLYDGHRLLVMCPFSVLQRKATLDVSRYCIPLDRGDISVHTWRIRYQKYAQKRGFDITPAVLSSDEDLARSCVDSRFCGGCVDWSVKRVVGTWRKLVYNPISLACYDDTLNE